MTDLFAASEEQHFHKVRPLAARMRPRSLSEFTGQQHFLGPGKLLWRMLRAKQLGSLIFFGPPGTGKTTLAQLLAKEINSRFRQLSAVTSGVKELRQVLEEARNEVATGGPQTLLFIDEIHRFNKSQQDALLPDVENGIVILIGATTSNPFFAVNNALISRSQVFEFKPLDTKDLIHLLQRALQDTRHGLAKYQVSADEKTLSYLANVSDGDARRALGSLEIAVLSSFTPGEPLQLTSQLAADAVQRKSLQYDGTGDDHYDTISAMIKSIRGSDPDAALYWLARMLEGGEEIRFLTRRLVILASEDIGNADPLALQIAVSGMQACEFIGLPECQLTLSQVVTYLACAPKSNACTLAIGAARRDVRETRLLPVPRHLKDSHYTGAKSLEHGQDYLYSHDSSDGIVTQDYLGVDREYYYPVARGFELELGERLKKIRSKLHNSPNLTNLAPEPPSKQNL